MYLLYTTISNYAFEKAPISCGYYQFYRLFLLVTHKPLQQVRHITVTLLVFLCRASFSLLVLMLFFHCRLSSCTFSVSVLFISLIEVEFHD